VEHNVQAEQPRVPSVVSQFAVDPEQRAELGSLQVWPVVGYDLCPVGCRSKPF
jgi:hypothetical protein